jgi:hypothetical protein
MKKQLQLGLLVEGNSTKSAILRLPKLAEELGPIKSTALRIARRLSHMLHGGYGVADYEELQAARLILLRVPDAMVPRVMEELCASELVFKDLCFVLCESWLPAEALGSLKSRGASVATVLNMPSTNRAWFVAEGDTTAVRQVRRFIERNEARVFEIRAGCKPLYFAAELLATSLTKPLFLGAQQALREGGICGNHLTAMLEEMAQKTFRALLKGSRTSWGDPLAECSPAIAKAHLDALHEHQPAIAEILNEQLAYAKRRLPKQES